MSHRRLDAIDVHAVMRRPAAGEKDRSIARVMRIYRKTVANYRTWAEEQHLLEGPLPDLAALHIRLAETLGNKMPTQNHSSVGPYQSEIQGLFDQGVGPRLVWFKLNERPGFTASESPSAASAPNSDRLPHRLPSVALRRRRAKWLS